MKKQKSGLHRLNWFDYLNITFMALFCIAIIFPIWDMLVRSLSSPRYSVGLNLMLFPKEFTISSYQYMLSDSSMTHAFLISVLRTVSGTALAVVMTILVGYPLSKRNLPGRGWITTFFLIPMFFGGGLIPSYLNIRELGLLNTFAVYIVPGCVSVYNAVLMRNYFMGMDGALEESASIDGAGYVRILVMIVVPLSKPIVATIALWEAVSQWNSWFDCMIYIRSASLEVVQIILRRMQDLSATMSEERKMFAEAAGANVNSITSVSVRMATTILTMLPIVCVYPFVQKYFVKGIMIGALKG